MKIKLLVFFTMLSAAVFAQNDEAALNEKGVKLLDDEEYSQALPIFEQLVSINPENTTYRNNRAVALFNLKKYQRALADYKFLDHEIAGESEYAFQIGNCYENIDSARQAIQYYTKAISIEKEDFIYFFKRGTLYLKKALWREAEQDFNQSLDLNPEHHNSLHNRGLALFMLGLGDAACKDWCEATALGNLVSPGHVEKNCKLPCK